MPEFGRQVHEGEVYVHRGKDSPTNALVILNVEGDRVTFLDTSSLNKEHYLGGVRETIGKGILEDFSGGYQLATPAQAQSVYSELKEQHNALRVKINLLETYLSRNQDAPKGSQSPPSCTTFHKILNFSTEKERETKQRYDRISHLADHLL